MIIDSGNRGQIMLITVMVLSSVILGASAIAGLLTLYQIRQSVDVVNSTKAIYAADAGLEWELYRFFKDVNVAQPVFANGADVTLSCNATIADQGGVTVESVIAKATGQAGQTSRAFQVSFDHEVFEASPFCTP